MGRRRLRLVPEGAVEVFEVRATLYFDTDGQAFIAADVSAPDGTEPDASIHEVLGVLRRAESILEEKFDAEL